MAAIASAIHIATSVLTLIFVLPALAHLIAFLHSFIIIGHLVAIAHEVVVLRHHLILPLRPSLTHTLLMLTAAIMRIISIIVLVLSMTLIVLVIS